MDTIIGGIGGMAFMLILGSIFMKEYGYTVFAVIIMFICILILNTT